MVTLGGSRRPLPATDDIAAALRGAAGQLGQRPAVTVLRGDRRDEQGFASLAQWASKGAHLIADELMLEPGDRIALAGPAGWLPAAVCLAAWWSGLTVVVGGNARVAVVHEGSAVPDGADEVLSYGDAMDGAPLAQGDAEPYAAAVQLFPDQPPASRAAGDLAALEVGDRRWTQRELLDRMDELGLDGPLGVDSSASPDLWIPAVAVRPLRAGRPTVVLAGGTRDQAEAEGVTTWA